MPSIPTRYGKFSASGLHPIILRAQAALKTLTHSPIEIHRPAWLWKHVKTPPTVSANHGKSSCLLTCFPELLWDCWKFLAAPTMPTSLACKKNRHIKYGWEGGDYTKNNVESKNKMVAWSKWKSFEAFLRNIRLERTSVLCFAGFVRNSACVADEARQPNTHEPSQSQCP